MRWGSLGGCFDASTAEMQWLAVLCIDAVHEFVSY